MLEDQVHVKSDYHAICVSCTEKGTNCLGNEYEDTERPNDAVSMRLLLVD